MTNAEILNQICARIVPAFHPLKIILFGSRATGRAHEDSDYDLLVVVPQADSRRRAAMAIRELLDDLPISKDIIVTTPERLANRRLALGSILRSAVEEGQVLFERD